MSVMKNFFNYVLQSVILMGYSTEPKHGQLSKSKWVVSTPSQSNPADTHTLKCFFPEAKSHALGAAQCSISAHRAPRWL